MGTCSLTPGCTRPDTRGGGCIQCKLSGGIRVNGITLFRHDRETGVTQMQKAREIYEGAKETGRDIMSKGAGRTPTEKMTSAGWKKA